jgi:hypothetical protein
MKSPNILSLKRPDARMLRYHDLMDEYGLTYNGAYDLLHRFGVKLGGGLYIKRSVVERVLEGGPITRDPA